jgi:hypothetical protein
MLMVQNMKESYVVISVMALESITMRTTMCMSVTGKTIYSMAMDATCSLQVRDIKENCVKA